MSNDEIERAIDFLLKSQANLDARIERTNEQLAQTNEQLAQTNEQLTQLAEQLGSFADTQAGIMRVMTRTFDAQAQINESLRSAVSELAARQSRTEDALTQLAETQMNTDRRLNVLIDIIESERNGQ